MTEETATAGGKSMRDAIPACAAGTDFEQRGQIMYLKVIHQKLGGHVHIDFFVGRGKQYTLALAGGIVLDPDQWEAFRLILIRGQNSSDLEFQEKE